MQSNRRTGHCHRQHIPEEILDKGHNIHLFGEEGMEGTIMVCQRCGHYGQMRWAGLTQICKGQKSKQKRTLKWFAQGKHPKPPHTRLLKIGSARRNGEKMLSATKRSADALSGVQPPQSAKDLEQGTTDRVDAGESGCPCGCPDYPADHQLEELEEMEREAREKEAARWDDEHEEDQGWWSETENNLP